jgi:hypothetical protein
MKESQFKLVVQSKRTSVEEIQKFMLAVGQVAEEIAQISGRRAATTDLPSGSRLPYSLRQPFHCYIRSANVLLPASAGPSIPTILIPRTAGAARTLSRASRA